MLLPALLSAAPSHAPLATALARETFVAYTPRSFSTLHGVTQPATAAGIRDDLKILRPHFSGLITYGLGDGQQMIPELAIAAGFRAIVLGVWDPTDRKELDRAIALAERHPQHIVALVLGNEGLFWKRYSAGDLRTAAAYARKRLPDIALGSSEPFAVYVDSPDAAALLELDLLLPNIHPRFEPWFRADNVEPAADFVVQVLARLHALTPKPILIKETGLPSALATQGFDEARQAEFWKLLRQRISSGPTQNLAGFEAFDAPWKPRELQDEFGRLEPSEAHWGLFRHDGTPKPAAALFHAGNPANAAAPP
jgi:exo-beta-1,3-glucanase (GH17 family)